MERRPGFTAKLGSASHMLYPIPSHTATRVLRTYHESPGRSQDSDSSEGSYRREQACLVTPDAQMRRFLVGEKATLAFGCDLFGPAPAKKLQPGRSGLKGPRRGFQVVPFSLLLFFFFRPLSDWGAARS